MPPSTDQTQPSTNQGLKMFCSRLDTSEASKRLQIRQNVWLHTVIRHLQFVIFWGLRLSLGHFGGHAPESPVSHLQNGVSTSFLPRFIVDLTFKDYPRSNPFFSMGILRCVKWQTSPVAYNGPKQQCVIAWSPMLHSSQMILFQPHLITAMACCLQKNLFIFILMSIYKEP